MPFQRFLQEFQSGFLVPCLCDEAFEHFTLVIDGSPQVMPFAVAVDLHEDLVHVPPPLARTHPLDASLADLGCEHWAEPVPPEPHRLVADVDAPLVQQVLHIAERQRGPDVHHHGQADDLGAGLEVAKRGTPGYPGTLCDRRARLKPSCSDTAL